MNDNMPDMTVLLQEPLQSLNRNSKCQILQGLIRSGMTVNRAITAPFITEQSRLSAYGLCARIASVFEPE